MFLIVIVPARDNPHAIADFKARLFLDMPDKDVEAQVRRLVNRSVDGLV